MSKVRKAVIDTNVLIYDLFEDSLHHEEASKVLDNLETWVIPSIVVHELIWFLKGLGLGARKSHELVLQYLDNEKTTLKPVKHHHIKKALNTILNENLSLSRYNDKLILAVATEEETPIATFDKKLRQQASKLNIPVIPKKQTGLTPETITKARYT